MIMGFIKKLIEVALPPGAIGKGSSRKNKL